VANRAPAVVKFSILSPNVSEERKGNITSTSLLTSSPYQMIV